MAGLEAISPAVTSSESPGQEEADRAGPVSTKTITFMATKAAMANCGLPSVSMRPRLLNRLLKTSLTKVQKPPSQTAGDVGSPRLLGAQGRHTGAEYPQCQSIASQA